MGRTAFEQAIGKAAGGASNIQAVEAGRVHPKRIEGAGELHVSRRATLACEIVSVNERGEEEVCTGFALNDRCV